MDEADLELVKDWLTRAYQDLRSALILAAADDAPLDVAIYHCQQAGEKAVKPIYNGRMNHSQNPQSSGLGDASGELA